MVHVTNVKKDAIKFSEVKDGSLFIRSGSYVLVRLDENVTNGVTWYNAVSITTGILFHVHSDEIVTVVEGASLSI